MALVYDGMPCSLCGMPIDNVEDCFTTTMVGLQPPLSQLDDVAAHHACVDAWEHKAAFVEAYNARWKEREFAIDEDGHVKWVGRRPSLLPWWLVLLLPFLMPVLLIDYLGRAFRRVQARRRNRQTFAPLPGPPPGTGGGG